MGSESPLGLAQYIFSVMGKSVHGRLLEDDGVRRWYENGCRGSIPTAEVYLRRLGGFCSEHGVAPRDMLALSEDEVYGLLLDTARVDAPRSKHPTPVL